MRSGFASLLEQAGFDTTERGFWERIVMVQNCAVLPAERLDEGDVMATRGFNALVLDRHGVPTFFCKCRPPTKEWVRQTELCTRISMEPALRQMIPCAWGVRSTGLLMSISTYVPGRLLESRVAWMRPDTLGATLREILQEMETISLHCAVIEPGVFNGRTHVDLAAESEWAFDVIPSSLLPPHLASVTRDALARAGVVRRAIQHGDLWPRNILRHDGHWWLLDFEMFGQIQVPLYDAFHLVRHCWTLRQGRLQRAIHRERSPATLPNRLPSWIGSLRSSHTTQPYQHTLAWASARHGLTIDQAVGTLAFYLIDLTARMYRRQVPMAYVEPYLRDLAVLAECLLAGETFADAFRDTASAA
ncbi:MAG TPA: phosphotransferase [Vicinamibacterales bacterium]|jgi:hypothetical protein